MFKLTIWTIPSKSINLITHKGDFYISGFIKLRSSLENNLVKRLKNFRNTKLINTSNHHNWEKFFLFKNFLQIPKTNVYFSKLFF